MLSQKIKTFLVCLSLQLLTTTGFAATTTTFTITSGSDDAEQNSSQAVQDSNASLGLMTYDMVGMRFENITIPKKAKIIDARLILTSDADITAYSRYTTYLQIDNSSENTFSSSSGDDIQGRVFISDPKKNWRHGGSGGVPKAWNEDVERRINVTALVKKVIEEGITWDSGKPLVFKTEFRDGDANQFSIYSYEGDSSKAPKLEITYDYNLDFSTTENSLDIAAYSGNNAQNNYFTIKNDGNIPFDYSITDPVSWVHCTNNCTGTIDVGSTKTVSVSYSNSLLTAATYNTNITITATAGSQTKTHDLPTTLTVMNPAVGTACGNVPIYAQNLVDPAIMILLDVSGSMGYSMQLLPTVENKVKTADITSLIQHVTDKTDWLSGNEIAFRFSPANYTRNAYSYNQDSSFAPKLYVKYQNGGNNYSFSKRIIQGQDDVEGNSFTDTGGNQLNFANNPVGLRFTDITIPKGATITSAYIEFTVISQANSTSYNNNIQIQIEDTDEADLFTSNGGSKVWHTPAVTWNANGAWNVAQWARRIDIAQDVIGQLVTDKAVSWGFGEWSAKKPHSATYDLYTVITAGIKHRNDSETTTLQQTIASTVPRGGTPLQSSLKAGLEYFKGNKAATDGTKYKKDVTCQPKFLISITDGIGNTDGSSVTTVTNRTNELANANISTVTVGFGISNATQIQAIAKTANARGDASDNLYALHEENSSGEGVPFLANNQQELYDALSSVTKNIKEQIFVGSSPAPSTSVQYGSFVLNASFNAANWSGELSAIPYDPQAKKVLMCVDNTGKQTCDQTKIHGTCVYEEDGQCLTTEILVNNDCICWQAINKMPATADMNAWTVAGTNSTNGSSLSNGDIGKYVNDTTPGSDEIDLAGDNYICKELGDIIKSTPAIVNEPSEPYFFDNYTSFKFGSKKNRTDMVYVGSNDGALHAFDINTGIEKWRFYPEALHNKIKANNICADNYCHESFVDASPIAEDIYLGSSFTTTPTGATVPPWRTVLLSGLGEGGAAYFALDITSANNFATGSSVSSWENTTYLWQFTDSELGFSTGIPSITKVSDTTTHNGGWAAYFGSGLNENKANWKETYIYGLNAYTGNAIWATGNKNRINYNNNTGDLDSTDIGAIITGATSGATAKISTVLETSSGAGGTGTLILENISGTFIDTENIRIDISGTQTDVANVSKTLHYDKTHRIKLEEVDRIAYSGRVSGKSFAIGNSIKGQTSGATGTVKEVKQIGTSSSGTLVLEPASIIGTFDTSESLQVDESGTFVRYAAISHGLHSAFNNDALSDTTVIDLNYDHKSDYLYYGNMYGRLYRISDIAYDEKPVINTLFNIHPTTVDRSTPIRAGATVSYGDTANSIWVYFGSGKFENQADKFNTDQQYFVGLIDNLNSPTSPQTFSDLLVRQTVARKETINGKEKDLRLMTGHTYTFTAGSGNTVTTNTKYKGEESGAVGEVEAVNGNKVSFKESTLTGTFEIGEKVYNITYPDKTMTLNATPWYAKLQIDTNPSDGTDAAERVVAKALVAGEVVFFTSFIPDDDVCAGSGKAWLYALDYDTGLPTNKPVFDINNDGKYDENDKINGSSVVGIYIGRGIPSAPVLEGKVILVNTTDQGTGSGGGGGGPQPTIIPVNLPGLNAAITTWKDGNL